MRKQAREGQEEGIFRLTLYNNPDNPDYRHAEQPGCGILVIYKKEPYVALVIPRLAPAALSEH